jgi:hypothetical protein
MQHTQLAGLLRDIFAAFALAGLLAQRPRRFYTRTAVRSLTIAAYEFADDMLAVRAGDADDEADTFGRDKSPRPRSFNG